MDLDVEGPGEHEPVGIMFYANSLKEGCLQALARKQLQARTSEIRQWRWEPSLWSETPRPFQPWLLLLVPAVGGLLSGLLVFTVAPEAEGHGTDAAIAAYHYHQGRSRPRVPLVKIVASALTIGSGGSGGREGPIAQIGAGFGSFLGSVLGLRPAERRILMAGGMGAGVAAIFRAPLAGALFAAEVLYRSPDFESEVIIPAALASITAISCPCGRTSSPPSGHF
jgi:CIC family chloride channel protein